MLHDLLAVHADHLGRGYHLIHVGFTEGDPLEAGTEDFLRHTFASDLLLTATPRAAAAESGPASGLSTCASSEAPMAGTRTHVTIREGALVRRALGSGRTRSLIAVLGIATSVLLVLVIFATYRSVEVSIDEFIGQPGIDLWVAPGKGTDNLVRSAGRLFPEEVVEDIAAIPGVREAARVSRTHDGEYG